VTVVFGILLYSIISTFNQKFELRVLGSNRISALSNKMKVYLEHADRYANSISLDEDPEEKIIAFISDQSSISARFITARSTLQTVLPPDEWQELAGGYKTWNHFASEILTGMDTGITGPSGVRRFRENLQFRLRIYQDKLEGLKVVLIRADSIMKSSLRSYRTGLAMWLGALGLGYGTIIILMQRHPLLAFRIPQGESLPGFLVGPDNQAFDPGSSLIAPSAPAENSSPDVPPPAVTQPRKTANGTLPASESRTREVNDPGASADLEALVEELRKKGRLLESRLNEKDKELRKLKAASDNSTDSQRKFLATLSHEIRTPLSGIMGMVELVAETPLNHTQQELVSSLQKCNRKLLNLVDSMIEFPGESTHNPELTADRVFKPGTVVDEAVAIFTEPVLKKGIELESRLSSELPDRLEGPQQKIHQVLVNLLSNAVRFTDHGGIMINVSLKSETEHQCVLRFEITDTGTGIPESAVPHLFQPIENPSSIGLDSRNGHGLGLHITRELVESMHGSVGYDHAYANGSLFYFEIPLRRVSSGKRGPVFPRFQTVQVLCLTDSPVLRWAMEGHSQLMRFSVEFEPDLPSLMSAFRSRQGKPGRPVVLMVDENDVSSSELATIVSGISEFTVENDESGGDAPAPLSHYLVLLSPLASTLHDISHYADRSDFMVIHRPLRVQHLSLLFTDVEKGSSLTRDPVRISKRIVPESELRVLAVEDAAISRELFSRQLELMGLEYEIVTNGQEAVEIVQNRRFDIILMDCNLPVMDGFEATRAIRRIPSNASIHIIGITANADPAVAAQCLESGMNDHLTKPLSLQKLENAIYARFPEFLF
jgi:signal transduction histidine kinase/CheY-like chemotaxis protein